MSHLLDQYQPSPDQQAQFEQLRSIIEATRLEGIRISIAGGYGLDGLYGKLTRDHDDIDMFVEALQIEEMTRILISFGFVLVETDNLKRVYQNNIGTKVEVAILDVATDIYNLDSDILIPLVPNAEIQGTVFRTPTIKGHQAIDVIQNIRAAQGGWGEYPHQTNKDTLYRAISEKAVL